MIARCGICTVSDTRTQATDRGGAYLRDRLTENSHQVLSCQIVPDDPAAIRDQLQYALANKFDLMIFTGGTGISARDRTPQVISPLLDRELPGFGELFRMLSYEEIGAAAYFSRATAGIAGRTAVFCLPGSPAALRLALDKLLLPELPHLLSELAR